MYISFHKGSNMDFRSRDANWATQLVEMFGNEYRMGSDPPMQQCHELETNLKKLLYKRTKAWWNKATLEQYLSKDITPRGLRVQVYPAFSVEDDIFIKRWEDACKLCSRTMIELLIGLDKKLIENLEIEIEDAQKELRSKSSKEALEIFEKELSNEYGKWETDIKNLKMKKYQRDITDYQKDRVFKWHQGHRNFRARSISRNDSISSNESNSAVRFLVKRSATEDDPGPEKGRRMETRNFTSAKKKTGAPWREQLKKTS
ncbi:uncharacterized protein [Phyllobates terribilis]|uniref:uncharacterized protein isoform X3 n=1 Tax=Phyllobates terribilis TaxID=111132 RepID=UPI003CCB081C